MTQPDAITAARELAQIVIPDDIADAAPEDDLRDHGLDSIRAMELLDAIESRGGEADFTDFMANLTLTTVADALAAGDTKGHS